MYIYNLVIQELTTFYLTVYMIDAQTFKIKEVVNENTIAFVFQFSRYIIW